MSHRALVIAYDFPPHAAIGTMRTLRLVRELSRAGWDVSVLTSSPATYQPGTPVDERLEQQIPEGVRVLRARTVRGLEFMGGLISGVRRRNRSALPTPRGAGDRSPKTVGIVRRAKDWLDAACSIPDNESGWIGPAVMRGLREMSRRGAPDVIYSSAPPWSGQVVAWALASLSRRPWVADFRDPWARAPWRDWRKPFRQRAAAVLERRVVARADAVLFVTRANLAEFAAFYGPRAAQRFHFLPNGCDPEEFSSLAPLPPRRAFVLLHAGTLYGARNPMPVIEATARAIASGALDRQRFRLRFLGTVSLATDLEAECGRLGIRDVVEFVPRVTRQESLRELLSASALLLVQTGTTVSVPGKAYEYLATGRPVLALSEEGETADLVRSSGIGRSVRPADPPEAITAALLDIVALAQRPVPPAPRELFDGVVHAGTAAHILQQFARHGRHHVLGDVPKSQHVAPAEAAIEGTRR